MATKFQIISPEATRNIITSPSLEGAAANFPIPPFGAGSILGWEVVGSVLAQSDDRARFGSHSLQVVTNGALDNEGTYFRTQPLTTDLPYAGSVYVRGEGRVRVRVVDQFNAIAATSDSIALTDDRWQRITDVVGGVGGVPANDLRLYIETDGAQAVTFYVDGAQLEQKVYSTSYIDGDQPGGRWNVLHHASESSRDSEERSGGRLIDLDEEDLGVYVTVAGGIGTPPLRHNLQGRALLPGVEFQSTKVLARTIQLTFWAKQSNSKPGALRRLHEVRQNLIDLIKPDVVSPTQPFVLRYLGGNFPVDIECLYEAGLEFAGDVRNQYFNSFAMRCLSTDPFWIEDDLELVELDFSRVINNADHLQARVEEFWQLPYDTPPDDDVLDIVEAPNGNIYIGGEFLNIDATAVNRIARYDGVDYNPLAAGVDDQVNTIAVAPDGTIYFGGDFLQDTPAILNLNRIARYDPATDTITALGAGLNAAVGKIAIHPITGDVYAGGSFDDVNGGVGNTLNSIARWDVNNLTWNPIGASPGLNGAVQAMAFSIDGSTLYVGGLFTDQGNPPPGAWPGGLGGIVQYDVATDTFSEMGAGVGFNGVANTGPLVLERGVDGTIYAGGQFVTVDGITVNRVAQWNGVQWSTMSEGMNEAVQDLAVGMNGEIFAVGQFSEADGRDISIGLAFWNGSVWTHADTILPGALPGTPPRAVMITQNEDVWIGGDGIGAAIAAGLVTVDNIGSADAFPVFTIEGPGTLVWLENITVGVRLYLDLVLQDGETVVIDLRTGQKAVVSDWSGNRIKDVLPNSDFATFRLRPGLNDILAFIHDDTEDTRVAMAWTPLHWSVDGTVND